MTAVTPDTEQLVKQARLGDYQAREQLLTRHRDRLRRMVAVRLDRRLAARIDPSDVVQETLVEAAHNLSDYLQERPLPFYPWLRRLAWERLVKLHRRHVKTHMRSVTRESPGSLPLPDESALELANRVAGPGTSPSNQLARAEEHARVQAALEAISEREREVLVMRYLEQLSTKEIAAALGINVGAVRTRHLRALDHLRRLLSDPQSESRA
jgi:RNA polymerase sigma-70 factor (ECF subfamily)